MLIIPAIDILGGKVVRLFQGKYDKKTIYNENPLVVAKAFQNDGADRIHIVDLDGAREGSAVNRNIIVAIRSALKIPIQVGGGIRNIQTAADYLTSGIDRIVIGSRAMDEEFLEELIRNFGVERISVSIDVKDRTVMTEGWQKSGQFSVADLIKKIKKIGVREVMATDVLKDGTLKGPNYEFLKNLRGAGLEIIAAGGIACTEDLKRLKALGIKGAIIGKALYEGKLSVRDLQNCLGAGGLPVRIIPCLDVKNGRTVKGVKFENLRDQGDPVQLAARYYEEGADELVFLDITATKEERGIFLEVVKCVAEKIFIPFTVGGGVRSVEDISNLLKAGADKVAINSAAISDPELINDAAQQFGSQCIVVAIDVKKVDGRYKVFTKAGSEETALEAVTWAKEAASRGAGELLITSMDRDGTKAGYDRNLLRQISEAVKIPVIASGGAGSAKDMMAAIHDGKVDAVLAASIFHKNELGIAEVKEELRRMGVRVRQR